MAKKLSDIIGKPPLAKLGSKTYEPNQSGYTPKAGDEKKFAAAHKIEKHDDRLGNDDEFFQGSTKTYDRSKDNMGYNPGQDKAAYMGNAPDKTVGESEEQIDELSKKILGSYVKKATSDVRKRAHREMVAPSDTSHVKKNVQRMGNINKAVNKLTKEDEQIDEISKKTLGSYVNKASRDAIGKARDSGKPSTPEDVKNNNKIMNRRQGIRRAVDRLTKEEAEQIDEKKKIVVSVKRPVDYKIADIGPGRKEHNVKTGTSKLKEEALPLRTILGEKNWIAGAIKHPGAEKKAAAKAGESTHEYMEKHKDAPGKAGKRARLGLELSKFRKEEAEQVDERLTKDAGVDTYIHDFVHSKNKKFAKDDTKTRIKRALGAFYKR